MLRPIRSSQRVTHTHTLYIYITTVTAFPITGPCDFRALIGNAGVCVIAYMFIVAKAIEFVVLTYTHAQDARTELVEFASPPL